MKRPDWGRKGLRSLFRQSSLVHGEDGCFSEWKTTVRMSLMHLMQGMVKYKTRIIQLEYHRFSYTFIFMD